jgi:hypothetical protein
VSRLTDVLQDELGRMVEATPAPAATDLAAAAEIRGHRIRNRRRAAGALAAAACVAAATVTYAGWRAEPAGGPATQTQTPRPTPSSSSQYTPSLGYRVTERCSRPACGALRIAAIDVGGTTYRPDHPTTTPLLQGSLDVSMTAGDQASDVLVLGGVVGGAPRPTFRVYVDGQLEGQYDRGRLALFSLPPGRHQVRVLADQYLPAPHAALVVTTLRQPA